MAATNGSISISGPVVAGGASGDARLQALLGDVSTGAVTAARDVVMDGLFIGIAPNAGPVNISAGRDVGIWAHDDNVDVNSVTAGDDIVLRAGFQVIVGNATLGGNLTSGTAFATLGNSSIQGAADFLATSSPMTMYGHNYSDLTNGSHIDIIASAGVFLGATGLTQAEGATSDVRIQNTVDDIDAGDITAGHDVGLDTVGTKAADSLVGAITAGNDVAIDSYLQPRGAHLRVHAGDDIVIRATANINARRRADRRNERRRGDIGGAADNLGGLQPMTVFGHSYDDFNGLSVIDVATTGGLIDVAGDSTTEFVNLRGGDVRFQATGSISTGNVTANGGDIVMDGLSIAPDLTIGVNDIAAGGDVALSASGGDIEVSSALAGDDIVMRAFGNVTVGGALTSGVHYGSATEGNGSIVNAGDFLATADPMTAFNLASAGHSYSDLTDGSQIDVVAGVANTAGVDITVVGLSQAEGATSDARCSSR